MAQRERPEAVGGVASPADDGGHIGSYTIPSDVMDQSASLAARGSGGESIPDARFALGAMLIAVLLFVMVALTLYIGM